MTAVYPCQSAPIKLFHTMCTDQQPQYLLSIESLEFFNYRRCVYIQYSHIMTVKETGTIFR